MFFLYVDESGTPEIPGNSSHYVLAGLSIPVANWKQCEREIAEIKGTYSLSDAEIHTGWLLRPYNEQIKIKRFSELNYADRVNEVRKYRNQHLLKLQSSRKPKQYKQTKKNYIFTQPYVHLTYEERRAFVKEICICISKWKFARLFAECIDKIYFDGIRVPTRSIEAQAMEQVVSRFEAFLKSMCIGSRAQCYGLLIHDSNETFAKKHTNLMMEFHRSGTLWTEIKQIIETPLFVDSRLTSMIQIADVCSYALRRYAEKGEIELFDLVFKRADRKYRATVGVRHFAAKSCECKICKAHRKSSRAPKLPVLATEIAPA